PPPERRALGPPARRLDQGSLRGTAAGAPRTTRPPAVQAAVRAPDRDRPHQGRTPVDGSGRRRTTAPCSARAAPARKARLEPPELSARHAPATGRPSDG